MLVEHAYVLFLCEISKYKMSEMLLRHTLQENFLYESFNLV